MTKPMAGTLGGAVRAGLGCARPRCGKGKLFRGFLCDRVTRSVGWTMALPMPATGPAVFIMFFAGFIVVGAALVTEVLYHPPYWVRAVLWLPLILIVTLGPLRPMKGLMVALQYYHKAGERRFGGTGYALPRCIVTGLGRRMNQAKNLSFRRRSY
jgi:uncharacterized protein (DUF983 family)